MKYLCGNRLDISLECIDPTEADIFIVLGILQSIELKQQQKTCVFVFSLPKLPGYLLKQVGR